MLTRIFTKKTNEMELMINSQLRILTLQRIFFNNHYELVGKHVDKQRSNGLSGSINVN